MSFKKYTNAIPAILGVGIFLTSPSIFAEECGQAPVDTGCYFTNVDDFEPQNLEHISFDPLDERDPVSITQKFGNIESFSISGGSAAIRDTTQHSTDFSGEGTEGGAVSGSYRIDWGYYGTSSVTITFFTPIDAVGGFFGGDTSNASLTVTYEDATTLSISRVGAGLPAGPEFASSPQGECSAINGFLGIDSNGGSKIKSVVFQESRDAASLDSIIFGSATGGLNGPGLSGFPEMPYGDECQNLGYSAAPQIPGSTIIAPEPPSQGSSNLQYIPQLAAPEACTAEIEGNTYYDANTQTLLVCDSTGWNQLAGTQGPQGEQGIQGIQGLAGSDSPFANITCTTNQVLRYNGSTWVCDTVGSEVAASTTNAIPKWDGSQLVDSNSMVEDTLGNVGIGTQPQAKLDVSGDIKIGNSSVACNFTYEGSQRYNSISKNMEFCNGSEWIGYVSDNSINPVYPDGMIGEVVNFQLLQGGGTTYTVPHDKTLYIFTAFGNPSWGLGTSNNEWFYGASGSSGSNSFTRPLLIPGGTTIKASGDSTVNITGMVVTSKVEAKIIHLYNGNDVTYRVPENKTLYISTLYGPSFELLIDGINFGIPFAVKGGSIIKTFNGRTLYITGYEK